jgi:hypothetical protein
MKSRYTPSSFFAIKYLTQTTQWRGKKMTSINSIEELINSKINALGGVKIDYYNASVIEDLSQIEIKERSFGRILFDLLKTHSHKDLTLITTNNHRYFFHSLCHKVSGNLPHQMNGLSFPSSADLELIAVNQVSPFLLKEFEDDVLCYLSSDSKKLHLRIPLISTQNSLPGGEALDQVS